MPLGSSEPGAARASSSRRRWKGPFLVHASGAPVAGSSVRLRRSPEIHQSLGGEIQPKSEAQTKIGSTPRQSETSLAAAGCSTTFSNMKPTRQPRSAARSSRTNSAERKKRLPRVPLWPVSAPIREKSWQGGAAIIRTTHSPAGSRRLFLHRLVAEVAPLLEPGETVGRQPPACPIRLPRHSRRRRAKEVFQDGHRRPHAVEEGEHDVPAGSARRLKGRLQHHRRLGRAPVGYPTRGRSPRRGPVLSLAPLLLRAVAVLRLGLAFPAAVLPRLGPITIHPSPVLGPVLPARLLI